MSRYGCVSLSKSPLIAESRRGYSASYTYDANGNRASRTVNGVTETYTVDSGDKLTQVSVSGVATKTFGYDGAGRTTSIQTSAGTTSFTYNGLDTRVGKTDSAGTATFRRMGASVTAPVLGDGSASFTPGLSERRGAITTFQHSGIKNTEAQSTSNQTLTATRVYDAFGNLVSTIGTFYGIFGYGAEQVHVQDLFVELHRLLRVLAAIGDVVDLLDLHGGSSLAFRVLRARRELSSLDPGRILTGIKRKARRLVDARETMATDDLNRLLAGQGDSSGSCWSGQTLVRRAHVSASGARCALTDRQCAP